MKHIIASSLVVAIAVASAQARAQTSSSNAAPKQSCAIAYVTGIGGSAQSVREYMTMANSNRYRYLTDNPIQCKVSDEGRTSDCVGLTDFRNERVSVYDDTDATTVAVVARVELDHGTYPAIVVVRREDVKCEE